jgi:hypothetical protein
MANLLKRRSIHSGRLERWLGKEKIEQLAYNMRNGGGIGNRWYYEPINLRDVPGSVWVTADGDFVGDFERGYFDSALDSLQRHLRSLWVAAGKPIYEPEPVLGAGFTSISDALSKASSGYSQTHNWSKTGPTGVVGSSSSMWRVGAQPVAGAVGAAAPGGTVPTSATTGALTFTNPATGTMHLTGADAYASNSNNVVMMYDRLFAVAKTINSTATEAVTGVPTRYQSTTAATDDYIGGNFLTIFVGGTALAATAHNWTVCTYTDQANAASTLPSVTGRSGAIVDTFDSTGWFCPLESGDVGIKALTQMQCSALVATGAVEFVIGHPIGLMMFPSSSVTFPYDWLTNRSQAPRIFNSACLAFLEMPKAATTATTYSGIMYTLNAP